MFKGDNCYGDCPLRNIIFFDSYLTSGIRGSRKRFFAADTRGDWNLLTVKPLKVFSDKVTRLLSEMTTNVQILTDDDEDVIRALVDGEKRITCVYQNIRRIPNALIDNYGQWVEILDFSHNKIRDVEELDAAFKLHTLILDHNLISSFSFFPWMPQLRVLWLNNNLIYQLRDFIPALSRACPNLVYLSLMGNAAACNMIRGGTEYDQVRYRQYVISYFAHLRHLDDKPVTKIERLRSESRSYTLMSSLLSAYDELKSFFRYSLGKSGSGVV